MGGCHSSARDAGVVVSVPLFGVLYVWRGGGGAICRALRQSGPIGVQEAAGRGWGGAALSAGAVSGRPDLPDDRLARPQAEVSLPKIEGIVMLALMFRPAWRRTISSRPAWSGQSRSAMDFVGRQPSSVQVGVVGLQR